MKTELNANRAGIDGRSVDRLVDGELPETERRTLLLQLDGEPDGWRKLALAFLEAQTWREAIRPLATPSPVAGGSVLAAPPIPARRIKLRRAARYLAVAASLPATFALGWILKDRPSGTAERIQAAADDGRELVAAVAPAETPPALAAAPAAGTGGGALEQLVESWERRGYTAEWQKSQLSLELRDGRKVEVPVREVRLRFDGGRTY